MRQRNEQEKPKIKVKEWLDRAQKEVSGNWNAMCLSTVDKDNYPDSRMVLFKQFSNEDNIISSLTIPPKKVKILKIMRR